MSTAKTTARKRRHARVLARLSGTSARPRLLVFRSLTATYAQLIDDETHKVLGSTSDIKSTAKGTKVDKAKQVGIDIAKIASDNKISEVVFDRNGYKYHGRVKAVAEGAREGGLKF